MMSIILPLVRVEAVFYQRHNAGNNQRRIAVNPFTAVKVNLMLNIVKTALCLGVCVYLPC